MVVVILFFFFMQKSAYEMRISDLSSYVCSSDLKNGRILRPLLNWRRSELVEVALENDLPFVDDPSNSDDRFDRARLRHALRPQTALDPVRSEQRRVGNERDSTCRARGTPSQ